MIKFVDLNTGNIFEGTPPYVFWFENEQSVNLIYTNTICVISDKKELDVTLPKNDIFKLINPSYIQKDNIINISQIDFYDLDKIIEPSGKLRLKGYSYQKYFLYVLYIIGSSSNVGEFVEDIYIDGEKFTIGADFYNANESLYINLSNQGTEIPNIIQKSIYGNNIHEEKCDNITMNRKFKELLSNYIDVLANKGSYKSLFNSLEWFEYGNLLNLRELWKINSGRYAMKSIQNFLDAKYRDLFNNFSKTTFISIGAALQKIKTEDGKIIYDSEKNPELEDVIFEWSVQDLSMKLCLLANFYKAYFMPIHLDLIHSTIEDVVFTNTFKMLSKQAISRNDFIFNIHDFPCSVQNGDIFNLDNVKCYVYPDTLFGTKWEQLPQIGIIGVQTHHDSINLSDGEKKTYLSQLYNSIGSIINFHVKIDLYGDYIKREFISIRGYNNNECFINVSSTNHKIIRDGNIDFQLLCKEEGDYNIKLLFETSNGDLFIKNIHFHVCDICSPNICIYKIKHKLERKLEQSMILENHTNDFIFKLQPLLKTSPMRQYSQYIPVRMDKITDNDGIHLNHLLIFQGEIDDANINNNYFIFTRKVNYENLQTNKLIENNPKLYTICISKKFNYRPQFDINRENLYREDYIYVPGFHDLEKIGLENKYNNFVVKDYDALCVIPELTLSKHIKDYEWEFVNTSTLDKQNIIINRSVQEPFISKSEKEFLGPGFYDVIFRYKLGNETKEVRLNSAFYKK